MKWVLRWKKYVFFSELEEKTPGEDDLDTKFSSQDLNKKEMEFSDVGPLNSDEDLKDLLVEEQFLKDSKDPYNNLHLKPSLKEDQDFILVTENIHTYLHSIYKGTILPRFSIAAEADDLETPGEK